MYTERIPYPFYTDNGTYRKFLGVIRDMSLWVTPGSVFPIRVVSVTTEDGVLSIALQDSSDMYRYTCTSDSSYIYDNNRVLSGLVHWNAPEVTSVIATIQGGDPIPWGDVYVLPVACRIKHKTPLFNVTIDGHQINDADIRIKGDGKEVKVTDDSINLYQYDEDLNKQYINRVFIVSGDISWDSGPIDGYIWLRSKAECNIRVNTDGRIELGTIIEGN